MKKAFLLSFITLVTLAAAQTPQMDKLKQQLSNHTQLDTFRVNRLNELATIRYLNANEREKFADEALSISSKINYSKGSGFALALLGSVKNIQGNLEESKLMFHRADSIANKSGNLDLQATVFWRMSSIEPDAQEKKILLLKADSIAKKAGNFELQALIQIDLGRFFSSTGSKKELLYRLHSEELAQKSGNKILLSLCQLNIGIIYEVGLSDYAKAMEYYLKGLRSAEEANDPPSLISCWTNIGSLYASLGDQANALIYLQKAEDANKQLGNKTIEASLQNSIGESYRLSGKYPEAINSYSKAIEIYRGLGLNDFTDESNLADIYTRMDSLTLAFKYVFSSLKEAKERNEVIIVGWANGILSRAYLKKNMPDSAIHYAELGLAAANQSGTIEFMRDNALALANAYAVKKNFEKAYTNHLLYVNYRDSMMNEEVRNRTAVQQYNFNLNKKEAQITVLNEQRKSQRNLLIGTLALLLSILASAILLLRNNRQKRKANKLLEKQKQEIDDKAHELSLQKNNLEQSYRNIELMGEIGRKITSSLSVETIISTAYNNVNSLMDASVFGIGIYNENTKTLDFPATYEKEQPLPFYSNSINDESRFAPLCFKSGKEIIMGNLGKEHQNYIQEVAPPFAGEQPVSMIYLPLMAREKKLGVITIQSFQQNAYSDNHLFMVRNIAIYAAIALENAEAYEELNQTFESLKQTQKQLIQSEKMASLGELTAGIAHEIQNPLNFVNNFSEVNKELIEEMQQEMDKGNFGDAKEIANDIKDNAQKINHHGKRADAIVKGMLQHSRSSSGQKELIDVNALADEYLRLSYHGLRAKDKSFNATMETSFDKSLGKINAIPQDMGRVLLNLFNNAFYSVNEKKKQLQEGYEPTVSIVTQKVDGNVEITVGDNGNGIPQNVLDKIFQPFFTTKPTGEGTGLGLSLSYDIIKVHGGKLQVETKEREFTEFKIVLPAS